MSLLDEAAKIAVGEDIRPRTERSAVDQKTQRCQDAWAKVKSAAPEELAGATVCAWKAEMAVATTATAKEACRKAADAWRARL